ncbi:MAG: hypothetical protein GY750_02045 [Lentisphaerae bacterium]|nr:hypothetical protein [Lentisphaerota bacterium]MCP4100203.1 hypothetical protein [Lentisphaerota bacterium]
MRILILTILALTLGFSVFSSSEDEFMEIRETSRCSENLRESSRRNEGNFAMEAEALENIEESNEQRDSYYSQLLRLRANLLKQLILAATSRMTQFKTLMDKFASNDNLSFVFIKPTTQLRI